MERLTGLDAGFLYMETPRQHLHTMKIAVLDPATMPDGYSFGRVKEVLAARLHLLPPFRQRLVNVPLGLHHPLWIEDPDFDLDHHIRHTTLPAPGGQHELDALVSRVASTPLDRRRPLWELWVAEGMAGGRVGFVTKIHHCAADGVKAAELLVNVLDTEADAPDPPPPARPWQPEPVPGRAARVWAALRERVRQLLGIPALVRRTVAGIRGVVTRRRAGEPTPPTPFTAPNLAFNRALTPQRVFSSTTLSLTEIKDTKTVLDATVNDVVLAVCAGALRRWLAQHDGLPDRPLIAGIPVSTRNPARQGLANSVSNLFTAIPVHVADPVERIRIIHDSMRHAREQHNVLGAEMLADWSELTPSGPFAAGVRLYSRLGLADRHRPPINLVISNVPGPREPLYVAGARLDGLWSMGPILENVGLNITVWSYLDGMHFGLVACPDTLADLDVITAGLPEALAELRAAF